VVGQEALQDHCLAGYRPAAVPLVEEFLLTPSRLNFNDRRDIRLRDGALLKGRLGWLRSRCNSSHEAEKVGFVHVAEPQVRTFTSLK
jgi:hypothetical protein